MALFSQIDKVKFEVGDTVKVYQKIIETEKITGKTKREVKEQEKERTQIFEGIVIAIRGEGENKSFTVRKISEGIGVERIWPVSSPAIQKIVVKKQGNVRRGKLYFLRKKDRKK